MKNPNSAAMRPNKAKQSSGWPTDKNYATKTGAVMAAAETKIPKKKGC